MSSVVAWRANGALIQMSARFLLRRIDCFRSIVDSGATTHLVHILERRDVDDHRVGRDPLRVEFVRLRRHLGFRNFIIRRNPSGNFSEISAKFQTN